MRRVASVLIALLTLTSLRAAQGGLSTPAIALAGEGASITGRLGGGGLASYRVTLAAGDFIHVIVEQQGIDVGLRFVDPDGKTVVDTDSQNGARGLERVAHIADQAGEYRVDLVVRRPDSAPGTYQLTVAALRRPTERDLTIVAAERAFLSGARDAAKRTDESRQRAIAENAEAASLFESAGRPYEAALTLLAEGLAEMESGRPRPALNVLPRALTMVEALHERPLQASILNAIGGAHDILGNLSVAMDHYERALSIARAEGLSVASVLLNNIGKLHDDQADFQRSLEYYRQALEGFVAANDARRQGNTTNNIGVVYDKLGERETALEYFERALPLRRVAADKAGEAYTLTSAGNVHRDLGRIDRALELYTQALALRRVVGDRRAEAVTLVAMANADRIAGRLTDARDLYEQALALQRAAGDRRNEALTLGALAKAWRADARRALESQRPALAIFRAIGDRNGVADMLIEGARASRESGRLDEALQQIEEALVAIEEVRGGVASEDLRASFFSGRHDAYVLATDVLMALDARDPAAGYATRALEMSERARARSLLDMLNMSGTRIRGESNAALIAREQQLGQEINAKGDRLLNAGGPEREVLGREVEALRTEYGEVQATIRRASPSYAALTQPHPLGVAEIQRDLLDDDTVLLEYALGETSSYLWRVDRHSLATFKLPAADVITAAVQDVRRLTTTRPVGAAVPVALRKAIARLSDLVIKPLGPDIVGKRLAIVADGALEYVPFAMLTTPGTDGVPLVASCELITLPSASALAVVREQSRTRERPSRGLAVLADPVFQKNDVRMAAQRSSRESPVKAPGSADLSRILVHDPATGTASGGLQIPRLPFTRTEATSILRTAAGSENFEAIGFNATKDVVLAGTLKPYRYVHFATHGYVDSARPVLSSLVFSTIDRNGKARDGFLRMHEIYNLELLADVVVLSACDTGLGREVKGEGLVGLTRGFMYAGAPRVVVSLWSVSDRATATLMGHFYREMIQHGRMPAAALRAAQRAMMTDRRWAHPYFWSAFVLQGDWR